MHIIVDIRTASHGDAFVVRAGEAWARLWSRARVDDTITFLIAPHQPKVEGSACVEAPRHFGLIGKKTLRPPNTKEISRCVSFSHLAPYDPSIPTVWHIWSNAETLYPRDHESSLARRYREWQRRRALMGASTLVVSDIQIGRELVELYNIREDRIEIIPHLPLEPLSGTPLQQILTPNPYFLYDGGYGTESGIMTLLTAWERYRHDGGDHELLLLGSAGDALSGLTQTIQSLDLATSVRYLGALDDGTLHGLYKRADGWIMVGPYYGSGPTIELARTYDLPMLLSDIHPLIDYSTLRVHPNHTTDITLALKQLETHRDAVHIHHADESYIDAYTKILAKGK